MNVQLTEYDKWAIEPYQQKVSNSIEPQRDILTIAKKNLELSESNHQLNNLIESHQHQLNEIKRILEPSIKTLMTDLTQKMISPLMESTPELHDIFKKASRSDGTICYTELMNELQKLKNQKHESDIELLEWQVIEASSCYTTQVGSTPQTIAIDNVQTKINKFIEDMQLIQGLCKESSELEKLKSADFILVDGKKLNQKQALSLLYDYMGMTATGISTTTKGIYCIIRTTLRLSSFVGLSIIAIQSPWIATVMILSSFTIKILCGVVSIIL